MLFRFTRRVFVDLGIWMIAFGLVVGVVFPPAVCWMGVPSEYAMTFTFYAYCLTAGVAVGATNITLAQAVVKKRLRALVDRLLHVRAILDEIEAQGPVVACRSEDCHLPVDSEDELGQTSQAFNHMVDTLAISMETNQAVQSFTEILVSQLDLRQLAGRALEDLMKHTKARAGALLVAREGRLDVLANRDFAHPEQLPAHPIVQRVLEQGRRETIPLPPDLALDGLLTSFPPREVVLEAISFKSVPMGLLVLARMEPFGFEQLRRLHILCKSLALALHNAISVENLQRLAAVDSLTGCFNRRFGLKRLREEFERATRHGQPLGLLLFDIDHFKAVNDTYGHLVGDHVLRILCQAVRRVLREGDVLLRYGGEEFLAVLPAASEDDAMLAAERIRRVVEDTPMQTGTQSFRITVSVGVTSYPSLDAPSDVEFLAQADHALYTAKASGRNRVCAGCMAVAGAYARIPPQSSPVR